MVDGAVGRDLEVLAARVEHAPRGVRVAVDGHRRAGLRAVGERLAVRRGHGVQRSVLHRDGARVEGGAGEHVEAGVAGVRPHRRRLVARLGVPGDVLRRPPVVGAQTVGVGDHQGAGGVDRVEQFVALQRGAVADHLVAGDQSGRRQVDQAVAAARHQGHVVGGAHDRHRVAHRHQFDRGDRGEHRRVRQRLLVDHRHLRPVDDRVAVGHRVAEAARGIGGGRGVQRARCPPAVACGTGRTPCRRRPTRCRRRAGGRSGRSTRSRANPPGSGRRGRTAGPSPRPSRGAAGRASPAGGWSARAAADRRCTPSGRHRTRRRAAAARDSRPASHRARRPRRPTPAVAARRGRGPGRPGGDRATTGGCPPRRAPRARRRGDPTADAGGRPRRRSPPPRGRSRSSAAAAPACSTAGRAPPRTHRRRRGGGRAARGGRTGARRPTAPRRRTSAPPRTGGRRTA